MLQRADVVSTVCGLLALWSRRFMHRRIDTTYHKRMCRLPLHCLPPLSSDLCSIHGFHSKLIFPTSGTFTFLRVRLYCLQWRWFWSCLEAIQPDLLRHLQKEYTVSHYTKWYSTTCIYGTIPRTRRKPHDNPFPSRNHQCRRLASVVVASPLSCTRFVWLIVIGQNATIVPERPRLTVLSWINPQAVQPSMAFAIPT